DDLIRLAETDRPLLAQHFSHEQLFASPQSDAAKDWFKDIALSASGLGTVQAAIALRDEDGRRDLAAVQVPAFILHGAKDVVVSTALAEIQQAVGVSAVPNASHSKIPATVSFTTSWKRFNRLFLDALRS
ncbi:MAG: alpha/beta hydrolase, partial [Lachnoclostridium sp.]